MFYGKDVTFQRVCNNTFIFVLLACGLFYTDSALSQPSGPITNTWVSQKMVASNGNIDTFLSSIRPDAVKALNIGIQQAKITQKLFGPPGKIRGLCITCSVNLYSKFEGGSYNKGLDSLYRYTKDTAPHYLNRNLAEGNLPLLPGETNASIPRITIVNGKGPLVRRFLKQNLAVGDHAVLLSHNLSRPTGHATNLFNYDGEIYVYDMASGATISLDEYLGGVPLEGGGIIFLTRQLILELSLE